MVLGMKPPLTVPLLYVLYPISYLSNLNISQPLASLNAPSSFPSSLAAMVLKVTSIILLLFLLLPLSSGSFEGSKHGISSCNSDHKDVSLMKMRKILMYEVHDYDDTMANTKHDPKKRPGSGKP